METIVDKLKQYFDTTPKDQIIKDWEGTIEFAETGPELKTLIEGLNKQFEGVWEDDDFITDEKLQQLKSKEIV